MVDMSFLFWWCPTPFGHLHRNHYGAEKGQGLIPGACPHPAPSVLVAASGREGRQDVATLVIIPWFSLISFLVSIIFNIACPLLVTSLLNLGLDCWVESMDVGGLGKVCISSFFLRSSGNSEVPSGFPQRSSDLPDGQRGKEKVPCLIYPESKGEPDFRQ